jgi:hypothetical protein
MMNLVREDIDFSKSLLSTVGKSFTREQWESLESDTKDREIALAMNKIGREYITKNNDSQLSGTDIDYKLIRDIISSKTTIILSEFWLATKSQLPSLLMVKLRGAFPSVLVY